MKIELLLSVNEYKVCCNIMKRMLTIPFLESTHPIQNKKVLLKNAYVGKFIPLSVYSKLYQFLPVKYCFTPPEKRLLDTTI